MPPISMESVCLPIRKDLEKIEQTLHALVYSPVEMVTQVASHIVHSGGKRLRPVLCLLAAKLFGEVNGRAIQLSCAFEFIHTATLLHDDVIDNATLRRNKASSNSLYCKATSIIAEDGDFHVLGIIARVTAATTEGEVLEIIKSNDPDLTEEAHLEIIHYKTACLISAATEVGALVGGASPADQARLKEFGNCLGMAFQLADDALDYVSSNEEIGKGVGTDLKEGKLTLPIIHALRSGTPEDRTIIRRALQNNSHVPEDLKTVLVVIDRYQGIQYTLNKAAQYVDRAKNVLAQYPDSPAKAALLQLADYVVERKK